VGWTRAQPTPHRSRPGPDPEGAPAKPEPNGNGVRDMGSDAPPESSTIRAGDENAA